MEYLRIYRMRDQIKNHFILSYSSPVCNPPPWKAAESGTIRVEKIFSVSKKPFLPAELVFRTFIKVLKLRISMAKKYVADLTVFRAQDARKTGAFLETGSLHPPLAALHLFPLLGLSPRQEPPSAVALQNAPAGAVPRTPFTRKGYATSVERQSR